MDLPLNEGDLIAGKYAVERVLGDGGMGVVVAARHLELGERVALKFLLPEAAKNPEACQRFVREARAAAKIKGEHVARVLDVGTREDGSPFIVMEYLEGSDLGHVVETSGPLTVADAVHYVLQACEAVAEAHALGIVHRDLKPANLFLTTSPDGSPLVKVLDFGISKAPSVFSRTRAPSITTVNASMGTPQYMSPEQARDAGKVDARSDVWALGAILYELLAGKPAFDADSVPALVMMIATEEPLALESLRPDAPVALVSVVRRCLQKNRDERFADVAELAGALEPFAPEEARPRPARIARILGQSERSAPPSASGAPDSAGTPAARTHSAWGRTGGNVRRSRARWLAFGLASATALVASGAFVASKRASPPAAAGPPVRSTFETAGTLLPQSTAVPSAGVAPAPSPSASRSEQPADSTAEADMSPPAGSATASEPQRTRAHARARARAAGARAFNATQAATELFNAASRASSCSQIGAPSGNGRATVTFAPGGGVRRVALSAPFAGSSNEPCVRDAFLAARVPAFSGAARTLEQRFRVVSPSEPGMLTFHSNVPAEVTLDGRSLGLTPKSLAVPAGKHAVAFIHPELGRKEQAVTLEPGQDKTLRATFSAPEPPHP